MREGKVINTGKNTNVIYFDAHFAEYRTKPMDSGEIQLLVTESGEEVAKGVVAVDITDIIEGDIEGFFCMLSKKLIGNISLFDIEYKAVGAEGDIIYFEVSGIIPEGMIDTEDK